MRSKKETRSLLPGVRRLCAGALQYATTLVNLHPMVVTVTLPREKHNEQGVQPTSY